MQNETQGNEQQLNLSVDLGGGRQVDVEIGTPDQLWVSAGPGIGLGDVWMKGEGRLIDLRVRIRRTPGGVEIVVDRGDTGDPWWPAGGAPRLAVAIDPAARTALAVASAGTDGQFQEVMLGKTAI